MSDAAHSIRLGDRRDLITADVKDFTVRRRTTAQQIYSLFIAAILIIVGVSIIVYNNTLLGALICFVVGSVMYFTASQFERLKNALQNTEFMNAMFTAALGMYHKFCVIVRQNGEIIYFDRGFQATFPHLTGGDNKRTLETWLEMYSVSYADAQTVTAMVSQGSNGKHTFPIGGGIHKKPHTITLAVEAIPRPSGFILLRGKDA